MYLASWGKKMAEHLGTFSYVIQEQFLVLVAPEGARGFPNVWWKSQNHRIVLGFTSSEKDKKEFTYMLDELLTQDSTDTEFPPTELLLAKPTFHSHTLPCSWPRGTQRSFREIEVGQGRQSLPPPSWYRPRNHTVGSSWKSSVLTSYCPYSERPLGLLVPCWGKKKETSISAL